MSTENVETIERAIEASVAVQPFVRRVRVKIDRERLVAPSDQFDYLSLTGDMMDVELEVEYGSTRVVCAMDYKEELRYPLMYVRSVSVTEDD